MGLEINDVLGPDGQKMNLYESGPGFSTKATLGKGSLGGVYTSPRIYCGSYVAISRTIESDVNSAPNGVVIRFYDKNDVIMDSLTITSTYTASEGYSPRAFFTRGATYFRYTYTNGETAQTKFELSVAVYKTSVQTSAQNLNGTLPDTTFVLITKSALVARDAAAGTWKALEWDNGALKVSFSNFPTSLQVSNFPAGFQVTNFPATQPVSAAALPLPTGAATAANQTALLSAVDSLTAYAFNFLTNSQPQSVKATSGVLGSVLATNPTSADLYIQFFNAAAATTVTPGTTAPAFVVPIPSVQDLANPSLGQGIKFSAGIKYAITTTPNGSNPPASSIFISIGFK